MVQMIGRGLRIVDPELYPNTVKTDCIVMDFGTSVITHGSLDDTANLDGAVKREGGEAPVKVCPECEAEVAPTTRECPFCGHIFQKAEKDVLENFVMTEYDLMKMSPFLWIEPFPESHIMMAPGFKGVVCIAPLYVNDFWVAMVKPQSMPVRTVAIGDKINAMRAADDFLREIEDDSAANKTKRWLNQKASAKQIQLLRDAGVEVNVMDFSWTKYRASCALGFLWTEHRYKAHYNQAQQKIMQQAAE